MLTYALSAWLETDLVGVGGRVDVGDLVGAWSHVGEGDLGRD